MRNSASLCFALILVFLASSVGHAFTSKLLGFTFAYMAGQQIDPYWDKRRGNPDVTEMLIRLSTVEGYLREADAKSAEQVENIRKNITADTTREEYDNMCKQAFSVIEKRLSTLEGGVPENESSARDMDARLKRSQAQAAAPSFPPVNTPANDIRQGARVPIDSLFRAWRELNFQSYMQQWSKDAVQFTKKGKVLFYPTIQAKRKKDFGFYTRVTAIYAINDLQFTQDGTSAIAHVTYSMSFQKPSGQIVSENNIRERYHLDYDPQARRWLIRENYDYL